MHILLCVGLAKNLFFKKLKKKTCAFNRVGRVERLAVGREPFGRGLGPGGAEPASPSYAAATRGRSPSQGTGAAEARGVGTGGRRVSATAAAAVARQRLQPTDVRVRAATAIGQQTIG